MESLGFVHCDPVSLFQIFVSRSYDATTHFEMECEDIKDMYRRITGSEFIFGDLRKDCGGDDDDDDED